MRRKPTKKMPYGNFKHLPKGGMASITGKFIVGAGGYSEEYYEHPIDYIMHTLAAFCDTLAPGKPGVPVDIFTFNPETGAPIPLGTMNNLGAASPTNPGQETDGAAIFPQSYNGLCQTLPLSSFNPNIIDILVDTLDLFAAATGYSFKDLDYVTRHAILSAMDKPTDIAGLDAKKLFVGAMGVAQAIYYSEICNVVSPDGGKTYKRNQDKSWPLYDGTIPLWPDGPSPEGIWHQMDYPGPSYKEPDFVSDIDGLRVTIADGKVKFQD